MGIPYIAATAPPFALPAPKVRRRGRAGPRRLLRLHPALEPLLPLWKRRHAGAVQRWQPPTPRARTSTRRTSWRTAPRASRPPDGWITATSRPRDGGRDAVPRVSSRHAPPLAGRPRPRGHDSIASSTCARRRAPPSRTASRALRGAVHDVLHGTAQEPSRRAVPQSPTPRVTRRAAGATYPRGRYGDSLNRSPSSSRPTWAVEVAFTEIGGWTRTRRRAASGTARARLRELGQALSAFQWRPGGRMQDVALVTMTEFGRTVHENGNQAPPTGMPACLRDGRRRGGARCTGRWPGLEERSLTRRATWPYHRLPRPPGEMLSPTWRPRLPRCSPVTPSARRSSRE